jgi:hypothetical protein
MTQAPSAITVDANSCKREMWLFIGVILRAVYRR